MKTRVELLGMTEIIKSNAKRIGARSTPLSADETDKVMRAQVEHDREHYRIVVGAGRNGGYNVVEPSKMGGKTVFSTRSETKANTMRARLDATMRRVGEKCHKCFGNSVTHSECCPLYDPKKERRTLEGAGYRVA